MKNRDNTGKEKYFFPETGKVYYVEYIEPRTKQNNNWGDIDPATKKVTGSYGHKHKGAIKEEESVITKENGFDEIVGGMGNADWNVTKMHDKWKAENGYT